MFLKFHHSLDKLSGVPTSRTISGYNGAIADETEAGARLCRVLGGNCPAGGETEKRVGVVVRTGV